MIPLKFTTGMYVLSRVRYVLHRHVLWTGVEFDLQVPTNWIKNRWSIYIYILIRSLRHTFKRKKHFSTHLNIYHIMPKQLIATKLFLSKIKHWRMTCMYNTKNTINDKQNNLKGEFTNSWPVVVWMFPKQGSATGPKKFVLGFIFCRSIIGPRTTNSF